MIPPLLAIELQYISRLHDVHLFLFNIWTFINTLLSGIYFPVNGFFFKEITFNV